MRPGNRIPAPNSRRWRGYRRVAAELTASRAKLDLALTIIIQNLDIEDVRIANLLELVYDASHEIGLSARNVRYLGGGGYEQLPPPKRIPPPAPTPVHR